MDDVLKAEVKIIVRDELSAMEHEKFITEYFNRQKEFKVFDGHSMFFGGLIVFVILIPIIAWLL